MRLPATCRGTASADHATPTRLSLSRWIERSNSFQVKIPDANGNLWLVEGGSVKFNGDMFQIEIQRGNVSNSRVSGYLEGALSANRVSTNHVPFASPNVRDDGKGNLRVWLKDETRLVYSADGAFGRLTIQRPGEPMTDVLFADAYRSVGVRGPGGINNEIDRIDGPMFDTIVEEKNGGGLQNPKNMKTSPQDWAQTQILEKTRKRIQAIQASTETFAVEPIYRGGAVPPSIQGVQSIRRFRFESTNATPETQAAVNTAIAALGIEFAGYVFDVSYGN